MNTNTKPHSNKPRKPKRTNMHEALFKAANAGVMGEFFKQYRDYGRNGF